MACETWRDKIQPYADAELPAAEMRAMGEHLRGCASCAADLLECVQLKRSVNAAGKRFSPGPELRQRIEATLLVKEHTRPHGNWSWFPKLAAAAAFVVALVIAVLGWSSYQQAQTFAELADVHVATLASAAPVDVVSTDRHTVKPWFEGKIPFSFNLPELANTPFTLEGGRMAYLGQDPGAQLIFRDGNHRISVFIFQNRLERRFATGEGSSKRVTFNVETWTEGELRYYVIGDAEPGDIHNLSALLRKAGA